MSDQTLLQASTLEPLSARVEERLVGPCRVLMLKTPVQSVVSWQGAFMASPDLAAGDALVQRLAVQLLDKGTQDRDRFAIAEILEDRGAQIQFSSNALRISFHGRALREDVPTVLQIMAESLRRPLFEAAEFEKVKAQYQASLQRSLANTAAQAAGTLSRRLYAPAHPNYARPTLETLARLDTLTVEPIKAYHEQHFGARDLLLVFVGDIDADAIEDAIREAFGTWPTHAAPATFASEATPVIPGRERLYIPDRFNLDVRMGHPLAVRRDHPDYIALYIANYILGGNFSARLMNKVRDELGLTYGIHSRLSGITADYEGHWSVGVTLSQDNLEKGIAATLAEVERFIEEGPTRAEVQEKQSTIKGSFKVGLATTGQLASTMYRHAIQGFAVDYLEQFPLEVEAVTLDQVRHVVSRHFKPDLFQIVQAGTLPDAGGDLPKP